MYLYNEISSKIKHIIYWCPLTYIKGIKIIIHFILNHFSLLYAVVCLIILLINLFSSCLYLGCSCIEISQEQGLYALNMNANEGGPTPTGTGGGDNDPGNQPSGWPKWPGSFSERSRVEGSPIDTPAAYNPQGTIPPANKHELAALLQYKVEAKRAMAGVGSKVDLGVGGTFHEDNIINRTVKSMLYNHITENSLQVTAAYKQLGVELGRTDWGRVHITSVLIRSLNNS